jgi:aspartate/methionine/tyrosine aminotransferase
MPKHADSTPPSSPGGYSDEKVAAIPMTAWGETVAPRYVRLVFSNEPVERLALLGERLRAALPDRIG